MSRTPVKAMPAHVFLSYSRDDDHQRQAVTEALTEAGLDVVWDQERIRAGQHIWNEIDVLISNSGCLLVILTPNSEQSKHVQREVDIARSKNIPIIPLLRSRRVEQLDAWWKERIEPFNAIETNNITAPIKQKIVTAVKGHVHRVCQTIALFNMKGGVGKTTLASQLGIRVNRLLEKNVLLIDLDPQQNLTELFLPPALLEARQKLHLSVIGLFEPQKINQDESQFDALRSSCIEGRDYVSQVDVLPINISKSAGGKVLDLLAGQFHAIKYTEIPSDERESAICNFRKGLSKLRRYYDYIFIDCNPSASLLSKAALGAIDNVLCPVRPDDSARRGLIFLDRAIKEFYQPTRVPELLIVLNVVPKKLTETKKNFIERLRSGNTWYLPGMDKFVGKYLKTEVPESPTLQSRFYSAPDGVRLGTGTSRSSDVDTALNNLVYELAERLEGGAKYAEKGNRAS